MHINSYYRGSPFYTHLYDRQQEKGHAVRVWVPVPRSAQIDGALFGPYAVIARNHSNWDRFLFGRKQANMWRDFCATQDTRDVQIVHAHSLFTNGGIARRLLQARGIPYVVAVRGTDVNVFFKRMPHLRALGVAILRQAAAVVFLSAPHRDVVIQRYVPSAYRAEILKKCRVVPNGLDRFWLENPPPPRIPPAADTLRLVYAGVINKNKNVSAICKACGLLIKDGIDATLTIVGRPADARLCAKLDALPYVRRLPPANRESLLTIYREGDLFVMPSLRETFGLVYAEAMSQCLPVLYTKGQGFDQQFPDGEIGYPVDPRAPQDIARCVRLVLSRYAEISAACVTRAAVFDWGRIESVYTQMYEDAVGRA